MLLTRFAPKDATRAAGAYLVLALGLSWPLVCGVRRDFISDLADPLLNSWVLAWGCDHLLRFFGGDLRAFSGYWDANIFYPHRLSLASSEHLFAQAVQVTPLWALTKDPILCYNLVFLSTFVLSAIGAYLLVRDLTGSPIAAFSAGLFFGFAPYRFSQLSHLQVLSSQWMPFALLGYRRFLATGRTRALAGATVALWAQGASCGYYTLFFPPFVAAFILFELAQGNRARSLRTWAGLLLSAAVVVLGLLPFLTPYLELRALEPAFGRGPSLVQQGSADVYSYLTAPEGGLLWGRTGWLRLLPRPEGALFPGFCPLLLAGWALVEASRRAWSRTSGRPPWRSAAGLPWLGAAAAALGLAYAIEAVFLLLGGRVDSLVAGVPIQLKDLNHALEGLAVSLVVLLAASPRASSMLGAAIRSPRAFAVAAALLAVWLSLGPVPMSQGRELGIPSLYRLLYDHVPGFDGVRAPARYAMVVALFLAMLAGYGVRALELVRGRWALLLPVLFLAEAAAVPLPVNVSWAPFLVAGESGVRLRDADLRPTPPPETRERTPEVYRYLPTLPPDAVVAELPIGSVTWEARYMFYSTLHWRPLLNGYSGILPAVYLRHVDSLRRIEEDPDGAFRTLEEAGVTHVVVHQGAWLGGMGRRTVKRLEREGAQEVIRFGEDVVLSIPRGTPSGDSASSP